MKAIILAAGYGRRMMPLTRDTHKTLLTVAGSPVLVSILESLRESCVFDILMVVGYRADDLQNAVTDQFPDMCFTWVENPRYRETNNIYSLALALEHTGDDDVLIIESDLVFRPDLIKRLLVSQHANVALLAPYAPGMDGTVVRCTSPHNLIADVIPPHLQTDNFDFSDKLKTLNIYRFSGHFCATTLRPLVRFYSKSFDENCYYEVMLGVLIYLQRAKIHGEVIDPDDPRLTWAEIDDPVDLEVAEYQMAPASRSRILAETHGGYWKYGFDDFHYLRNVHFPTDSMLAELRCHLPNLLYNYGSSQRHLDRKLAYLLDCEPEQLVTLNGCAQIYPWLQRKLDGYTVLIPAPTFGEYPRIFPNAATYADYGSVDWSALAERVQQEKPGAVVFVNPNNPSGTVCRSEFILQLARTCPATRFIVDESFLDFSHEPSLLELELGKNAPDTNILLLKSLSKCWGTPGLRLGFVWSLDSALSQELRESLPIWNVNSMAEYFLEMLFKNRPELQESFEQTRKDRDEFQQQLVAVDGIEKLLTGGGNFIIAQCCGRLSSQELVDRLLIEHNIYVKDVTDRWPDQAIRLRIAVRDRADNERFVAAIQSVLKTAGGHHPS